MNAAGEGRASWRTVKVMVPDDVLEDGGNGGIAEHRAAMTRSCTGNINTSSLADDTKDATASTWVGYIGWVPDEGQTGMRSAGGTSDLAMEVGSCEVDRAVMPARILRDIDLLDSRSEQRD